MRGSYRVYCGILGEIEHLEETWEDNIKMNLQKLICVGIDLIDLTQDRDTLTGNCEYSKDHKMRGIS